MDLNDIRIKIDSIDAEIMTMLNRRIELAVRARRLKTETRDSGREEEVLNRVRSASRGLIEPDFSEKLFTEIMGEFRKLEDNEYYLIGFQGEHGAYSEMALKAFCPDAVPIPHPEFADVFDGVVSGTLDRGVVPVYGRDEPLQLSLPDGSPALLAPGNTWVELVPAETGSLTIG